MPEYPVDPDDLRRLANATRDAQDFHDIATVLTRGLTADLLGNLRRALKGTLSRQEVARAPYQYQAQLWMWVVLDRAGLNPTVPLETDGLSPDYLVDVGLQHYGVEVKRPGATASAEDLLHKAAKQLWDYGVRGAITMDLTDCLSSSVRDRVVDDPATAPETDLNDEFDALHDLLEPRIFDRARREYRPGYQSVMLFVPYVRVWRWDVVTGSGQHGGKSALNSLCVSSATVFASTENTLWHRHAIRLKDSIQEGMETVGMRFRRQRDEQTP